MSELPLVLELGSHIWARGSDGIAFAALHGELSLKFRLGGCGCRAEGSLGYRYGRQALCVQLSAKLPSLGFDCHHTSSAPPPPDGEGSPPCPLGSAVAVPQAVHRPVRHIQQQEDEGPLRGQGQAGRLQPGQSHGRGGGTPCVCPVVVFGGFGWRRLSALLARCWFSALAHFVCCLWRLAGAQPGGLTVRSHPATIRPLEHLPPWTLTTTGRTSAVFGCKVTYAKTIMTT